MGWGRGSETPIGKHGDRKGWQGPRVRRGLGSHGDVVDSPGVAAQMNTSSQRMRSLRRQLPILSFISIAMENNKFSYIIMSSTNNY